MMGEAEEESFKGYSGTRETGSENRRRNKRQEERKGKRVGDDSRGLSQGIVRRGKEEGQE